MMAELGVDPTADPARLSGGEARRAAIVRTLSPEPDILLLDEPTNHLDLIAIEWLEARLAASRSALALISHDKRLLADLTRATIWLDRGRTRRLEAGFGAFEAWRDQKLEEEELERHKLDRKIVNEEHWMRYGVTARRKRNMRRVGELADLRRERREALRSVGAAAMVAQDTKASGALVIDAERISKAYGDRTIVRDFSLRVMRRDRIGIVGANGAGKTTLINLLTGALAPDSGSVRLGANVSMASLDQGRASLEPATTLVDALTGGGSDYVTINGERRHVMGYMRDFLFPPEQARTPIGKLSGGERGRLMLARALAKPSNLMVLDEPTNDLDIETLDLLQELLGDYAGTILLVSHDRDFLDRVATSVIVGEGDGRWAEYAGGYSDMVAQRGYGLAGPLASPVATTEKADKQPSPERSAPKRKLGFKEKRTLETLPGKIEKFRADLDVLERKLADADLPAREPAAFMAATKAYGELRDALAGAEDEWLGLEILREELERQ
jgi:ATP-binding cassette subfamily F protein uup